MTHTENRRKGTVLWTALLGLALGFGAGCGDDSGPSGLGDLLGNDGGVPGLDDLVDPGDNPVLRTAAEACGIDIDCKGAGIEDGNASISGVASVDAFFQSVINFQTTADAVSGGINVEVEAIAAGFGVAADADLAANLKAKIDASVTGGLKVVAEPAKCQVDAHATLEAQARCDASIDPGSAMVSCSGSCEVEASANVECDASAELRCTIVPPSGECSGECSGTCEVELEGSLACDGTCKGTCDGNCDLEDGSGNCNGKCDGKCTGSCEAAADGMATCEGTCRGECTFTPPDGNCEGGIRAECRATGDASVMCSGKCEGEFEPPKAKAECEASAKAEASLNVECSPPRLAIEYELNASLDADARAEFLAGIKNLELHLPAMLAKVDKAELVVKAGTGLVADGAAAVKGSVAAIIKGSGDGANLRAAFGLKCALGELDNVGVAIGKSSDDLQDAVSTAADVAGAIGMK